MSKEDRTYDDVYEIDQRDQEDERLHELEILRGQQEQILEQAQEIDNESQPKISCMEEKTNPEYEDGYKEGYQFMNTFPGINDPLQRASDPQNEYEWGIIDGISHREGIYAYQQMRENALKKEFEEDDRADSLAVGESKYEESFSVRRKLLERNQEKDLER
jgi:hypothetical protein